VEFVANPSVVEIAGANKAAKSPIWIAVRRKMTIDAEFKLKNPRSSGVSVEPIICTVHLESFHTDHGVVSGWRSSAGWNKQLV